MALHRHASLPTVTLERARELRLRSTPADRKLWSRLRAGRPSGFKFRRQHPIGPYIVDFYFEQSRIVIELDGHLHGEQIQYDSERQAWLESCGYRVLRFTNNEVMSNLHEVLVSILRECTSKSPSPSQLPQAAVGHLSRRERI